MKLDRIPPAAAPATLQDVIDRLAGNRDLPETRKRDLRSAVVTFGKLMDRAPAVIPLDLADIRAALDAHGAGAGQGLAQALGEPAQRPRRRHRCLRSAADAQDRRCRARRALEQAAAARHRPARAQWPVALCPLGEPAPGRAARPSTTAAIARFIAELEATTLIRNLDSQHRSVATGLEYPRSPAARRGPADRRGAGQPTGADAGGLGATVRPRSEPTLSAISPGARCPIRSIEHARARALAPRTLHLRRDHIHSAVTAACAAGIDVACWTSLASLVEPESFKALLRQLWEEGGRTLTAYTHGVAGTLVAIAAEWVKLPAETVATLKQLRRKLGTLPSGLTEKNKALLRKFDDAASC